MVVVLLEKQQLLWQYGDGTELVVQDLNIFSVHQDPNKYPCLEQGECLEGTEGFHSMVKGVPSLVSQTRPCQNCRHQAAWKESHLGNL